MNHGLRFYRIPTVKKHHGRQIEEVTTRRRMAWIAAINLKAVSFEKSPEGARVCSKHFHKGKNLCVCFGFVLCVFVVVVE